MSLLYPLAERFFAPQGEGLFTGTPMAFIRFVGCSVGKGVCHNCDTAFERIDESKGGGRYSLDELFTWFRDFKHVCLTGGEPLDRNLQSLIQVAWDNGIFSHIETSGTKHPDWLDGVRDKVWLCVSPKPGYFRSMIANAHEVKVILQGLGTGEGWPTLDDAREWAQRGKLVYIQPANRTILPNDRNLQEAIDTVLKYPELRLSIQQHKFIGTR